MPGAAPPASRRRVRDVHPAAGAFHLVPVVLHGLRPDLLGQVIHLVRQHRAPVSGLVQVSAALAVPLREQVHGPVRVIIPRQVRPRRAALLARLAPAPAPLPRGRGRLARLIIAAGRHRRVPAVARDQPFHPGQPLRELRVLRLQLGDLRVLILQQRPQRLVLRPQPGHRHAQRSGILGHTGRIGHTAITPEPALREQHDTLSRPAKPAPITPCQPANQPTPSASRGDLNVYLRSLRIAVLLQLPLAFLLEAGEAVFLVDQLRDRCDRTASFHLIVRVAGGEVVEL